MKVLKSSKFIKEAKYDGQSIHDNLRNRTKRAYKKDQGSGKTVLLSNVSNYLAKSDDWIVVGPRPKDQILENVSSEIYETTITKRLFPKGEFSFSFQGVSFSLKGKEPATTAISLIKKMVGYLNKKRKKGANNNRRSGQQPRDEKVRASI